jgi:hypothetical protein
LDELPRNLILVIGASEISKSLKDSELYSTGLLFSESRPHEDKNKRKE